MQLPLHLPQPSVNDVLREKIKDIEFDIIAAEARGDVVRAQVLHRERARLVGLTVTCPTNGQHATGNFNSGQK